MESILGGRRGAQGPAGSDATVTLSNATPAAVGTAASGSSGEVSRADHVHANVHATSHVTGGSDVIANAVSGGSSGLMSGADKAALDSASYAAPAGTYVASTSDDTPTVAITYAIATRKAGILELYASAYCTADNTASTFAYRVHVRRGGAGAPVQIGATQDLGTQTEAGCSIAITYSGSDVVVTVTGDPAKGIAWDVGLYRKAGFR